MHKSPCPWLLSALHVGSASGHQGPEPLVGRSGVARAPRNPQAQPQQLEIQSRIQCYLLSSDKTRKQPSCMHTPRPHTLEDCGNADCGRRLTKIFLISETPNIDESMNSHSRVLKYLLFCNRILEFKRFNSIAVSWYHLLATILPQD